MNALRAQAVAARSYGLAQHRYNYLPANGPLSGVSSTCDTQSCQVYRGVALRTSVSAAFTGVDPNPIYEFGNTNDAVAQTANEVRLRNGAVVSAMFSSSSGGFTSSEGNLFPAVEDVGDAVAANHLHNWTKVIPTATIEATYPSIGTLQSIVVNRRNGLGDFGGRITPELGKVVVFTGDQGSVALTGDQVRSDLGLFSNWFAVRTACVGRDEPTVTATATVTVPSGFTPVSPSEWSTPVSGSAPRSVR
jgi:SpoIID/LytB domain protein